MRKFLPLLLLVITWSSETHAFRDVSPFSELYPSVQNLVEKGVLEDGTFLRAESDVPAQMFWKILLLDAGFNPKSATFNTPLPANVKEDDPMAQFLREAVRRGFIDVAKDFVADAPIPRYEAIEAIVKVKGIRVLNKPSRIFLTKTSGAPEMADYLPAVEAAFASHILEEADINPLRPHDNLSRRELIQWISNFEQKGEKVSSLNPRGAQATDRNLRTAKRRSEGRPSSQGTGTGPAMRIEMLSNETSTSSSGNVRAAGSGLRVPNGAILEDVFRKALSEYRFSDQLSVAKQEAMIDAAIAAMVSKMGDKYSNYIEASKSKTFQEGLEGQFEGIGAYVEMIEDKFVITAPIKGSPAEDAGVLAGDVVTKVDGIAVAGLTVNEIVDKIKGPAGTQVTLTIMRDPEEVQISIIRGKIKVPSITIEWKNSIPVIGIHQFQNDTQAEFSKILKEEVFPKNPRGLVLDLRNNPGGFLNSAVAMGEFFLRRDALIFSVEYKDRTQEFRSAREGELVGKFNKEQMVVLINKGSASASEIFAAMMQDYGLGVIMGTKSVGKGTVQQIQNYSNGGILKLTVAKWLTPHGHWIQEGADEVHGVIPDIEVPDTTPEEKRAKIDRQLNQAVQHVLNH